MPFIHTLCFSPTHPTWITLQVLLLISISAAFASINETDNKEEKINSTIPEDTGVLDNAEDLQVNSNVSSLDNNDAESSKVEQFVEGEGPKNVTTLPPSLNTTVASSTDETNPEISQDKIDSDQKRTAHILTYKFMGSLFMAYILICVFLAIKNGPMFTY